MGVLTVKSVTRHPTDANKLRVTFSEAVNLATLIPSNFTLTPALTIAGVVVVAGSGDTQADLLVGSALASDGSTIALWQFDELAGTTAADTGPSGYTLTDSGGSTIVANGIYAASRLYDGSNDVMLSANTLAPRAALLGDWTVEAAVRWDSGMGATGDILTYSGLNSGVSTENTLMSMSVSNAGRLSAAWENGAGVSKSFTAPTGAPTLASGIVYAVAAVKKNVGGVLDQQVSLYLNGVLIGQSEVALTNADGGSSADMRFSVGRVPAASVNPFKGLIDVVRLSSVARTGAVIQAGADALLRPFTKATYSLQVLTVQDNSTLTAITAPNGVCIFSLYGSHSGNTDSPIDWQLFRVNGGATYFCAPSIEAVQFLTFSATAQSVTTVRVLFSRAIQNVLTTTARYQISGPTVLTVTAVNFTGPGNSLDLTVSGLFQSGTYVLTIDQNTMNDIYGNSNTGTASFTPPITPRAGSQFNPRVN